MTVPYTGLYAFQTQAATGGVTESYGLSGCVVPVAQPSATHLQFSE
jgi:hypothetical protein